MKKVGQWVRKYWWTLVAGVAMVLGVVLGGMFGGKKKDEDVPSFADMAKEEIAAVQEEIDVEKAKVKAETEEKLAELDRIERMKDDEERRKQLASFLDGL